MFAATVIEERAYKDTWSGGIASYLKYMYERLVLRRELLTENGSTYVHLDWHVGHYVKVMMDESLGMRILGMRLGGIKVSEEQNLKVSINTLTTLYSGIRRVKIMSGTR